MKLADAFADRLVQLLNERNWSAYKLSCLTGVPNSTISNLILGKSKSCTLTTTLNLCRGFRITLEQFFSSPIFDLCNLDDD